MSFTLVRDNKSVDFEVNNDTVFVIYPDHTDKVSIEEGRQRYQGLQFLGYSRV